MAQGPGIDRRRLRRSLRARLGALHCRRVAHSIPDTTDPSFFQSGTASLRFPDSRWRPGSLDPLLLERRIDTGLWNSAARERRQAPAGGGNDRPEGVAGSLAAWCGPPGATLAR